MYAPLVGTWCHRERLTATWYRSLYLYVDNNPLFYTDPSGLDPFVPLVGAGIASWLIDHGVLCGSVAHRMIQAEIERLKGNSIVETEKSISVLSEKYGTCKMKSLNRVDAVQLTRNTPKAKEMKQRPCGAKGFIWEIKPDTNYGRTQGPRDIINYSQELASAGIDAVGGIVALPGMHGAGVADKSGFNCGFLSWGFDPTTSGMIYYEWSKRRERDPVLEAASKSAQGGAAIGAGANRWRIQQPPNVQQPPNAGHSNEEKILKFIRAIPGAIGNAAAGFLKMMIVPPGTFPSPDDLA